MAEWLLSLAVSLVGSHPAFATFLMIVGILRVAMKPLMVLIESVVASTETKADDKVVEEVKKNDLYKGFLFVLDWLASIKLPKK